MKAKLLGIFTLFLLAGAGVVYWAVFWNAQAEKHFKVELTLAVSGDIQRFSAVQALKIYKVIGLPLPNLRPAYPKRQLQGEAVTVQLDGKKPLFALLRTPASEEDYRRMFSEACGLDRKVPFSPNFVQMVNYTSDLIERFRNFEGTCTVPLDWLPAFVWFENPGLPGGAHTVESAHFATQFSADVQFISLTLTTTDAPLSMGIKDLLPWLVWKPKGADFRNIQAYGQYELTLVGRYFQTFYF